MLSITREYHFSAGHTLWLHIGKCNGLHGHNYRVEVTISGEFSKAGMVMDFDRVDRFARPIIDTFDHTFVINSQDNRVPAMKEIEDGLKVVESEPTAEFFAMLFFNQISDDIEEFLPLDNPLNIHVESVTVHETDRNSATYSREENTDGTD